MGKSRKLTIGILAHVDAGKTTLSEAMLYKAGAIRQLGRVDHASALLDSDEQERERGITIFAGQAQFSLPLHDVTLLDTPGHVDFTAEMERTLGVLDYGILVISGRDGVQGHTATLWKLLQRYEVPAFIFVNKMDAEGTDAKAVLQDLKQNLSDACVDFGGGTGFDKYGSCDGNASADTLDIAARDEELAMCDETLMEEYFESGQLSDGSIACAIAKRQVFPVFFGSALKLQGVDELMDAMDRLAVTSFDGSGALAIRPFKITRDRQGERLTHLKVEVGTLNVRDVIDEEKVNQIRIYSGSSFETVDRATAGTICAVTGLAKTAAPEGVTEAVISYSIILPEGVNVHDTYMKLKQLEEEDPQLHISWNEQLQEIQTRLMGKVQLEVLEKLIEQRFGINVRFGEGRIAFRETIAKPVLGAGHYEPLRHYSEVHLLLEPLESGKGMEFATAVSSDVLDTNWQRLIMQHLIEKEHAGTLTGSPIADIKITIVGGRAHDKHTEGGDFRQSTYRTIRQALRKSLSLGDMVLLEPWYSFELSIPQEMLGRAMADIQKMGGECSPPETEAGAYSDSNCDPGRGLSGGAFAKLTGKAPVSEMKDYVTEVASYTKGYGRLSLQLAGYEPCHNQDAVVAELAYDPDRDVANPSDSIFCSHGAGHNVPWDEADEMMHVQVRGEDVNAGGSEPAGSSPHGSRPHGSSPDHIERGLANDKELERIFERTFNGGNTGKNARASKNTSIEAREFDSELERRKKEAERKRRTREAEKRREEAALPEYLLVDGYNIIFAWDELKELARINIDAARETLIQVLSNYQGYRKCEVIAVFDAYKVKGGQRRVERQDNIIVVYTGEAETADTYIERTTYQLSGKGDVAGKEVLSASAGRKSGSGRAAFAHDKAGAGGRYRVRVATSDRLEQTIIMGNNAHKVSAADFKKEVEQANAEIAEFIRKLQRQNEIDNPNKLQIPKKG